MKIKTMKDIILVILLTLFVRCDDTKDVSIENFLKEEYNISANVTNNDNNYIIKFPVNSSFILDKSYHEFLSRVIYSNFSLEKKSILVYLYPKMDYKEITYKVICNNKLLINNNKEKEIINYCLNNFKGRDFSILNAFLEEVIKDNKFNKYASDFKLTEGISKLVEEFSDDKITTIRFTFFYLWVITKDATKEVESAPNWTLEDFERVAIHIEKIWSIASGGGDISSDGKKILKRVGLMK